VRSPGEEVRERGGKSPGDIVESLVVGLLDGGDEAGTLGGEPADGIGRIDHVGRWPAEPRSAMFVFAVGVPDAVGLDERVRLLGQGEVGGQDPAQRCPDVLPRKPLDVELESLAGEQPEQVVEAIAHATVDVLTVGFEQGRVDQTSHQLLSLLDRDVQERRRDPGSEGWPGKQPEQAEQPLLLGGSLVIAECEAGPDLPVSQLQLVEPTALAA
jgi:hypothetical protein